MKKFGLKSTLESTQYANLYQLVASVIKFAGKSGYRRGDNVLRYAHAFCKKQDEDAELLARVPPARKSGDYDGALRPAVRLNNF